VIDLHTGRGLSSSSVVLGSVSEFLRRLAPSLELTYVALEFGTRPIAEVLAAPPLTARRSAARCAMLS
jgi:hypothetical protein